MPNGLPPGVYDAEEFHSLPPDVQESMRKMKGIELERWVINNYPGKMRFEIGRRILRCCSAPADPNIVAFEECMKRMNQYLR